MKGRRDEDMKGRRAEKNGKIEEEFSSQYTVDCLTSGSWRARPRRQEGGTAFMASVKISSKMTTAGEEQGEGGAEEGAPLSLLGP